MDDAKWHHPSGEFQKGRSQNKWQPAGLGGDFDFRTELVFVRVAFGCNQGYEATGIVEFISVLSDLNSYYVSSYDDLLAVQCFILVICCHTTVYIEYFPSNTFEQCHFRVKVVMMKIFSQTDNIYRRIGSQQVTDREYLSTTGRKTVGEIVGAIYRLTWKM